MNAHVAEPIPSLRAAAPDVPPGLDEVVRVALAKDPEARFATGGEMAAAMDEALVDRGP